MREQSLLRVRSHEFRLALFACFEPQIAALARFPVAPPFFVRLQKQRRHGYRFADFVEGHKSEKRRGGMFAFARRGIFRKNIDAHFHRCVEGAIDLRLKDNQVSHTHGI